MNDWTNVRIRREVLDRLRMLELRRAVKDGDRPASDAALVERLVSKHIARQSRKVA